MNSRCFDTSPAPSTWNRGWWGMSFGVALASMLVMGCGGGQSGPPRGEVSGKVTLDGTPVEEGSITFLPSEGTSGPSAGAPITNGNYAIARQKGPVEGKYRVEIRATRKTGKSVPAGSPFPEGTMIDETEEAVPAKYNTKSELVREIVAGENELDFDLTAR
ncbi:MAG: hypothetical protein WD045_11945 [Pirellulaceae bacterium]